MSTGYDKCTTVVHDVNSGEYCTCGRMEGYMGTLPMRGRGSREIKNPGQVQFKKKQQPYLAVYKYSNNIFSR